MTSDLLIAEAWGDDNLFDRLLSNPTQVAEEKGTKISNIDLFLARLQNRPTLQDENLTHPKLTPLPCWCNCCIKQS